MDRQRASVGLVLVVGLLSAALAYPAEPDRRGCTKTGTRGDDLLRGTPGNDVLCGGRGNDRLVGGRGRDQLIGGRGRDLVSYATAGGSVTVNLAEGVADAGADGRDSLSKVEAVEGGPFDDVLMGSARDDHLDGGGGANELLGGSGADTLSGGPVADLIEGGAGDDVLRDGAGDDDLNGDDGDDVLYAGDGNDLLDGGLGRDLADFGLASEGVNASLLEGLSQGQGLDELAGLEGLRGSSFADVLQGDAGANELVGDAGNDVLDGLDGIDLLVGGEGDDELLGGADDDTGFLGWGVDTFDGGPGADTCNETEAPIGSQVGSAAQLGGVTKVCVDDPPPVGTPVCVASLYLRSIEVIDDTEIGQEEWIIDTLGFPGGQKTVGPINADVGEGVVATTRLIGVEMYSPSAFPREAKLFMAVDEDDSTLTTAGPGSERGLARQSVEPLRCPDRITVSSTVQGSGWDPVLIPEFFAVELKYQWVVKRGLLSNLEFIQTK